MPVFVTASPHDLSRVPSDSPAKARHRAHQSTYREEVLALPPGQRRGKAEGTLLGNLLPEQHDGLSAAEAGWNLMSPAARRYAHDRLAVIRAVHGVAEPDRLWRNMLSSQPLAFSVVGELRAHEEAALTVLGRLTGLELAAFDRVDGGKPADPWALDGLQAEWAPPKDEHTGDKSGFDVAAVVRTVDGQRVLITVEVKYVDTFSPKKLDPAGYRGHLATLGLTEAKAADLVALGASQFLRSVMLTESVRRHGLRGEGGLDQAVALVLGRGDDAQAHKVVEAIAQACTAPDLVVGLRTHEELFDVASGQPPLRDWAQAMRLRYLTR